MKTLLVTLISLAFFSCAKVNREIYLGTHECAIYDSWGGQKDLLYFGTGLVIFRGKYPVNIEIYENDSLIYKAPFIWKPGTLQNINLDCIINNN